MAKGTRPGPPTGLETGRREELIEIACLLFAEKGFDGSSLQEIADKFGILKGSLFHYIRTKNELLYEIIRSVYVGAEGRIWSIMDEAGSATTKLHKVIIAYVTYIADHQPWVTVWLHDLGALDPGHRKEITWFEERDRGRLTMLVTEAQREGSIASDLDPQIVAFSLLGAMNWVHRWYRPGRLSPREIAEVLARVHLRLDVDDAGRSRPVGAGQSVEPM